jgi:DNA invertase Pin-like site-specific DNA recombinase
MFEVPETRYAKSGDVNIAYQVAGDGPFDLIHVPAFVSNLELQWEDPAERRYYERLASFCRLIMFDKTYRGDTTILPGMHAVVYTRISQDQTGDRAGVSRQLDDCSTLAENIGATVVAHFDDNDISAFNGKTRPGFEAMLDMLKRGEADTVIVWHPDRLYRSMKDLERLIDVVDSGGIAIRSCNGGDLDLTNSTGRMLARIIGSVSRQESEHKGERRRRANLQRAQAGTWRASQPRVFGYTPNGEVVEPEATAVRHAIHDVLAGRSLRSIAAEWNQRGLRTPKSAKRGGGPWANSSLRRALMRPVYAGLVVYQGKVVGRGDWEPLIDEDTHRGLVAFLSDPARRPATAFERKHMGSTVYRCGVCDGLLYAAYPGTARQMVYACKTKTHVARMAAPLDELVEATVLRLLSDADIASQLTPREGFDIAVMHAQRAALQSRMDELARMFGAGEIDAAQLRSGTVELRGRLGEIDRILSETAVSPAIHLLDGNPNELQTRWEALSVDMRGKIVDELMTVVVHPTPRGIKGVRIDRDTGRHVVNLDYLDIKPKV